MNRPAVLTGVLYVRRGGYRFGVAKMTAQQINKMRTQHHITLLELAALTGLPSGLIEKIEEGEVVPLESDLSRIEKALLKLRRDMKQEDSGRPPLRFS